MNVPGQSPSIDPTIIQPSQPAAKTGAVKPVPAGPPITGEAPIVMKGSNTLPESSKPSTVAELAEVRPLYVPISERASNIEAESPEFAAAYKDVEAKINALPLSGQDKAELKKTVLTLIEDAIGLTEKNELVRLNESNAHEKYLCTAHFGEDGVLKGDSASLELLKTRINAQAGGSLEINGETIEIAGTETLSKEVTDIIEKFFKDVGLQMIPPSEAGKKEETKKEKEQVSGVQYKTPERAAEGIGREKEAPGPRAVRGNEKPSEMSSVKSEIQRNKERREILEKEIKDLNKKIDDQVLVRSLLKTDVNSKLIEQSDKNIADLKATKTKLEGEYRNIR